MWEFRYKNQYLNYVSDLLQDEAVRSMRRLPRRATGITPYHHCLLVSYAAWGVCLFLGLDARAAARGGLLRGVALPRREAGVRFSLTRREAHILEGRLFRCPEALLVRLLGGLCTAAEALGFIPLLTRRRQAPPFWLDAEWASLPLGGAG